MRITLEINNPHYSDILQDMAQAAGVDPQELCAAVIENQLAGYDKEVKEAKLAAATWRLPKRYWPKDEEETADE